MLDYGAFLVTSRETGTFFPMRWPWPQRSCRISARGGCVLRGWTRWTRTARSTSYSQDTSPLPKTEAHRSRKHCLCGDWRGHVLGAQMTWTGILIWTVLTLQSPGWRFTTVFPLRPRAQSTPRVRAGTFPSVKTFPFSWPQCLRQEENQPLFFFFKHTTSFVKIASFQQF